MRGTDDAPDPAPPVAATPAGAKPSTPPLTRWLASLPLPARSAFAIAAAFTAYFSMYAFRKPWAAATFEGALLGVDLKVALMLGQLAGYALSKFLGIRLLSELDRRRRAAALVGLIATAELALLAFALAPPPGQVVCLFVNGLPLGMVWGLVFSFLEGRRNSELLGAGLSASYIVASGAVKSVGKWLMDALALPEAWMPAAVGALFLAPFLVAVAALHRLPPPDADDERARTRREAMTATERRTFFRSFAPGLVSLTALYVLLTGYRDVRDNFSRELFDELGLTRSTIFVQTETGAALVVLLALALVFLIRDNRRALLVIHGVMLAGAGLILLATAAWQLGWLGGFGWMALVGAGLYLAYVPYGCVLFDRMIAAGRVVATSVFMIYVTDAMGYAGSIAIVSYKSFASTERSWLPFFAGLSYTTAVVCLVGFALSLAYFRRRLPAAPPAAPEAARAAPSPS